AILQSAPLFVGQTLTGTFSIANKGGASITFDELVLGGRLNGVNDCSNYINKVCPDFTKIPNPSQPQKVTLNPQGSPGDSYEYTGTFVPALAGTYDFQVFYRLGTQWIWKISNVMSVEVRSLAPAQLLSTTGLNGDKLAIAQTYNRIGGALENQLKPFASNNDQLRKLVAVALGVWWVESKGEGPFGGPSGQPTIRFENHVFWNQWVWSQTGDEETRRANILRRHFNDSSEKGGNQRVDQWFCRRQGGCDQPADDGSVLGDWVNLWESKGWEIVNPEPTWQGETVQSSQAQRYAALELATTFHLESAYRSISMGGPQIMGFNYGALVDPRDPSGARYASASTMFNAFSQFEFAHVKGFVDYMKNHATHPKCTPYYPHPISYAQTQEIYGLACAYNGAGTDKGPHYQSGYNYAKEALNITN
ncbi:MAG: N-acetylmuramidase domain-containing protein, partial [Patescibacteria group bacterium]